MFALFVIGWFTERLFGNAGFLVLYLLGGIAASLTSLSIHPTIIFGRRVGAIFALYGGLIGFLLVRRSAMSYATATSLALNAAGFVAFNLFYGLTKAHIDMAAHVGGLLAGVPIGAALAFGPAGHRAPPAVSKCPGAFGAAILVPAARRVPVLDDWPSEFTVDRSRATRPPVSISCWRKRKAIKAPPHRARSPTKSTASSSRRSTPNAPGSKNSACCPSNRWRRGRRSPT